MNSSARRGREEGLTSGLSWARGSEVTAGREPGSPTRFPPSPPPPRSRRASLPSSPFAPAPRPCRPSSSPEPPPIAAPSCPVSLSLYFSSSPGARCGMSALRSIPSFSPPPSASPHVSFPLSPLPCPLLSLPPIPKSPRPPLRPQPCVPRIPPLPSPSSPGIQMGFPGDRPLADGLKSAHVRACGCDCVCPGPGGRLSGNRRGRLSAQRLIAWGPRACACVCLRVCVCVSGCARACVCARTGEGAGALGLAPRGGELRVIGQLPPRSLGN